MEEMKLIIERLEKLNQNTEEFAKVLRETEFASKEDIRSMIDNIQKELKKIKDVLSKEFKSRIKDLSGDIKSRLDLINGILGNIQERLNLISDRIDLGISKIEGCLNEINRIKADLENYKNQVETDFLNINDRINGLESRLNNVVEKMPFDIIISEIDNEGNLKKIVKPTALMIGRRYLILYKGGFREARIRFRGRIRELIEGLTGSEVEMDHVAGSNFLKKEIKLVIPGNTWIRYLRHFYHIFVGMKGYMEIISNGKIDALLPIKAYTRGIEMVITFFAIFLITIAVYNYVNTFVQSYLPILISFGLFIFTFVMGILAAKMFRGD